MTFQSTTSFLLWLLACTIYIHWVDTILPVSIAYPHMVAVQSYDLLKRKNQSAQQCLVDRIRLVGGETCAIVICVLPSACTLVMDLTNGTTAG